MSNPLLARLAIVYGPPDSGDPAAYLAEVARMLVKYSDADLQRAGDLIIRTHRGRSFPTPAQIVTACEDAKPEPAPVQTKNDPAWSAAAFADADRLLKSDMGHRAAREGWALGLHDYCRKHRCLPTPAKIATIIGNARFVDRVASGEEPLVGPFEGALRKMARTFQDKRSEVAAKALEGVTDSTKRMTGEAAE